MGRAAELLDSSAGQCFRAAEERGQLRKELLFLPLSGSLRSAAAVGAEPSELASSSLGFPEFVCFCWGCVWQEISEPLLECCLREAK